MRKLCDKKGLDVGSPAPLPRDEGDQFPVYSSKIFLFLFLKIYFIDYAIIVVPFSPHYSSPPCTPLLPSFPPFSSRPWVIHIHSLASTFPNYSYPLPVYFLPAIYATYSLYLFPLSPPPTPLLIILHVISISVILFLF